MLQEYQFTQFCSGGKSLTEQMQALGLWTPGMFVFLFAGLAQIEEDTSKL